MHRFARVATIVVSLLAGSDLAAQTCLGRPFFSTGHIQLGAGISIGNDVTALGGEIAVGKDRSFFVQGTISHETLDSFGFGDDPSGIMFGGGVGYQIPSGRVQLCPFVSGRTGTLDLPGDGEMKRSQIQFVLMVGQAKPAGSGFHFVPFGGFGLAQLSTDFEGPDESDVSFGTDTYFPLILGLGMHFSRSFALVGDVTIPIDLGSTRPTVGIRGVFPFGGRQ
jgi:hypothetical protein